jgi:hypothetical protein
MEVAGTSTKQNQSTSSTISCTILIVFVEVITTITKQKEWEGK